MQKPRSIPDTNGDLVAAFPQQLADEVRAVLAVMPEARFAPVSPFSVDVGDEAVAIPYRIYLDEPPVEVVRSLTAMQRAILHCLYSRYSDGLVRQRHLEQIVSLDTPWVVPFVVQLVGEYVLEILEAIRHPFQPDRSTVCPAPAVRGLHRAESGVLRADRAPGGELLVLLLPVEVPRVRHLPGLPSPGPAAGRRNRPHGQTMAPPCAGGAHRGKTFREMNTAAVAR
ncbi:hypothetical protein ABZ864_24265 [Streptomyces sp. NPDC047082]|uniref:hypothetical protein n=1 Tax=Streptomyces sp. NPDC047082 TaxID=3155259 RepID=UPI0033C19E2A